MVLFSGGRLGGLLGSSASIPLEPETVTYFAAMDAAGESYWPSEKALIDNLVKSLKSASLWARATLLWVPVGASLSGAMRALKHPLGVGTVMTNVGFTQDKWNRLVGLDNRQSNHGINTLTSEQNYVPNTSTHILVASENETATDTGTQREVGALQSGDRFMLIVNQGQSSFYYTSFLPMSSGGYGSRSSNTPPHVGVYGGTVEAGFNKGWANNVNIGSLATNGSVDSPVADSIYIFRGPGWDAGGTGSSRKTLSFVSIGRGLTDTQYLAYHNAIQAVRTARAALTPP